MAALRCPVRAYPATYDHTWVRSARDISILHSVMQRLVYRLPIHLCS